MNAQETDRFLDLVQLVESIFAERPTEKFTYSQVCYAIGEKRKAGTANRSPTFSACKLACEALVNQGKLKKEVNGRRAWYVVA